MNNTFWDDEDPVSEYELVEEAQEVEELAAQYAEQPVVVEADEEELEEILEEASFDLDHEEANIVYNTRIRLEQAKLYEMLINHDLFEGVNVDARAVSIVRNELKHYIVKRLEILMGLREPVVRETQRSEFNSVEKDFLRQLAAKGTKGRSLEAEDEEEYETPKPKSGGLKPLTQRVKSSELKPLAKKQVSPKQPPEKDRNPRKIRKTTRKTAVPREEITPAVKKIKKKTQQNRMKVKSGAGPRDLRKNEIEALAKEDLEMMKDRKPFDKMSAKEKAKMIKEVNERHPVKQKPNTRVLPHMDANQLVMKYTTEQTSRSSGSGKQGQLNQIMSSIATKIAAEKNQE